MVIGIGEAYPCSASAKNTTVFTRSAAAALAVAAADEVSATAVRGDGGHGGDGGMNLPRSRLSRYSAACNKAAMLMFDGVFRARRLGVSGRTPHTKTHGGLGWYTSYRHTLEPHGQT